ncbi:hypothetical protein FIU83_07520 [Halomonas sp. THAF5a]|uniref:hypothetical protein n=1 Tax=Halomonas sp. THAF5a TaxID=2587844 RepID=UPI00126959E5|nr:hypothetical protein [Halomonas sp. THAF5a]QFU01487.1 hypothetical protein FIU83_07520 [Halomonas sp. THAF5a]
MTTRRLAAWATAWLLLASQALAQPAGEITLPATVLSEGYSPAVTVSGRALVGVMLDPEGHPNRQGGEQRLHVWLPEGLETQNQQLCITLSSRDGLYTGLLEASLDTLVSPSDARPINVTFASQHEDYYSRYQETPPPHRLAVLAEIKSACTTAETASQILPVAWADQGETGILNVIVNSSRMRTLFAVPVDRPGEEGPPRHLAVECDDIDATQRIAFDTICRVDLARLQEAGTPRLNEAQLVRMRGPSPARTIPVPLAP